jgi:hypothetical protein
MKAIKQQSSVIVEWRSSSSQSFSPSGHGVQDLEPFFPWNASVRYVIGNTGFFFAHALEQI